MRLGEMNPQTLGTNGEVLTTKALESYQEIKKTSCLLIIQKNIKKNKFKKILI